MKVKFNRAALAEALGLVTSVVPSRTPKPILQCVKITCKNSTVRICGTDLEAGINLKLEQAEIESEGEIVVPADKFNSIVRECLDEVISVETSDSAVNIVSSDSRFTIYGHEPEQYPLVPEFEGKPNIVVGLDKLQEGIEQTLFAAAKESTRYAINGVLWEIKGKKLILVSTDGRRLAKAVVDLDQVSVDEIPTGRLIVPTKVLALLDKVVGGDKDEVKIQFKDNKIIMSSGAVVVSSNLVEGNFPKYEDIIPKDNDKKVMLSTESALSAVKRAALLTNEDSKGIKLALDKGEIVFTSRAPETGDARINMAVEYSGSPIAIGFNPSFLVDVLRVMKEREFSLELGESDRPGLIKAGSNFQYIVMPVNLD
jgi:DNA polymerase-3 subunit beta